MSVVDPNIKTTDINKLKSESVGLGGRERSFRDLIVWQKAHELVLKSFEFSRRFPKDEMNGITEQFRQCVIRIPEYITEGFKRNNPSDRIKWLNDCIGALERYRYYLILFKDLGYGQNENLEVLIDEIESLIIDFVGKIKNNLSLGL